jgi:hypothetical protein
MSAGDIDNVEYSDEKWKDFRDANPRIVALLTMGFTINQQYDIPYLGGISGDSRTVYIDRHFNRIWRGSDIGQFIAVHETSEWYCIIHLGMGYTTAHRWANTFEDHAVAAAGLDPKGYNKYVDTFVPKIEDEQIKVTPRDLASYPYATEPTLWGYIQRAMV